MKKRKLRDGMTQELSTKIYKISEKVFKDSYGDQKKIKFRDGDGQTATLRGGLEELFIYSCEKEFQKKMNELTDDQKNEMFDLFSSRVEEYEIYSIGNNVPMTLEGFRPYICP